MPYSGFIGFAGVALSSMMLVATTISRQHNVVMVKIHEEIDIVELQWHTFFGGYRTKYTPAQYIKSAKLTRQNKGSDKVHFKVPYEKANFTIMREGEFLDSGEMKRVFGAAARHIDEDDD
eukprot:CAMPEP_0197522942 /NCGR_PEP_ID=MMETSP1318-20131121/7978_1 /TAXON_ID=552666 /ORGANISM="Partenskyella glossopodia, Strain RCC365" /LENGTH=119 /DNA_ID=CAMNT_0043075475 /DNA_START=289 /DNA_END=648 /DNA_ORIENTATION=-